jgi:competence protein ComEC
MKSYSAYLSAIAFLTIVAARCAAAETLDIYFIDVEGGQSTLLVTPKGKSLLIDTGWAGDGTPGSKPGAPSQSRDANRIVAAARDAGIKQIDCSDQGFACLGKHRLEQGAEWQS